METKDLSCATCRCRNPIVLIAATLCSWLLSYLSHFEDLRLNYIMCGLYICNVIEGQGKRRKMIKKPSSVVPVFVLIYIYYIY